MKERKLKRIAVILGVLIALLALAIPVFADVATTSADTVVSEAQEDGSIGLKAIACAIAISIAAAAGAIAMAIATKGAADAMARQPEKSGEIRTFGMLGFVFIETAIIYALLVVILIMFVL